MPATHLLPLLNVVHAEQQMRLCAPLFNRREGSYARADCSTGHYQVSYIAYYRTAHASVMHCVTVSKGCIQAEFQCHHVLRTVQNSVISMLFMPMPSSCTTRISLQVAASNRSEHCEVSLWLQVTTLCFCMTMSRLEFYRATYACEHWVQEYETFGDYTQGNKSDSAASGAGVSAV
jgi:hypothetical protein